jgi:hypothetical protein
VNNSNKKSSKWFPWHVFSRFSSLLQFRFMNYTWIQFAFDYLTSTSFSLFWLDKVGFALGRQNLNSRESLAKPDKVMDSKNICIVCFDTNWNKTYNCIASPMFFLWDIIRVHWFLNTFSCQLLLTLATISPLTQRTQKNFWVFAKSKRKLILISTKFIAW